MSASPEHYVLICSTCQGPIAAETAQKVLGEQLPPGFATRLIACMAGCERPMTVGLQARHKAQYLFGDITSLKDLTAVVEFAHQYLDSEDGWTSASERPPALLTKTLSRLPCLPAKDRS
jgi:predicted metal-binding protein